MYVHKLRPSLIRSKLRGSRDRLQHAGDATSLHQIGQEPYLCDALEVGSLCWIACLDQGLPCRPCEPRDAAAQNRLLAEQVANRFSPKRRLHQALAPDGRRVISRQPKILWFPRSDERRHPALAKPFPDRGARPNRRHQYNRMAVRRHDLAEDKAETVGKEHRRLFGKARLDL